MLNKANQARGRASLLVASILIIVMGICLVTYYFTHGATHITLKINNEKTVEVPTNGSVVPFSLDTQTTTGNGLGYTLSVYSSVSNSDIVIAKDDNNGTCAGTTPLSSDEFNPSMIEVTSSANTSGLNVTTVIYCASVTNSQIATGPHNVTIAYLLAENQPPSIPTPPVANASAQWVKANKDYIIGDSAAHLQVDIDSNMIPVVNKADYEANNRVEWASYDVQKWANAVTVSQAALQNYQNAPVGTDIQESDIMGYWVYIPRYAYEVMRYAPYNAPITSVTAFDIKFEKATDSKKIPYANTLCKTVPTAAVVGNGGYGVDYRTGCGADRTYGAENGTTWSTHPAFTFGGTELNGFWVGKFETSGPSSFSTTPYIKPNQQGISGQNLSGQFGMAQNMSLVGGANTHNLSANADTRITKNKEWGALIYLTTSIYGKGTSEIYTNNCRYSGGTTRNNRTGWSATTPSESAITSCYNSDQFYNGSIGINASNTGTVYGVYDLQGGNWEGIMATYNNGIASSGFTVLPDAKYYDNYDDALFSKIIRWIDGSIPRGVREINACTYEACGGQANYETAAVQAVSSGIGQVWGGSISYFAEASSPWISRSDIAGIYGMFIGSGTDSSVTGWRAVQSKF